MNVLGSEELLVTDQVSVRSSWESCFWICPNSFNKFLSQFKLGWVCFYVLHQHFKNENTGDEVMVRDNISLSARPYFKIFT